MEYEIIKYDTSDKNWLNRRKNYIGASDFGVMLGQDTYKSALKLWQEKVGIIDELSKTTDAGLLGHVMEEIGRASCRERV
jgi:predicted phage-related endonuclease